MTCAKPGIVFFLRRNSVHNEDDSEDANPAVQHNVVSNILIPHEHSNMTKLEDLYALRYVREEEE